MTEAARSARDASALRGRPRGSPFRQLPPEARTPVGGARQARPSSSGAPRSVAGDGHLLRGEGPRAPRRARSRTGSTSTREADRHPAVLPLPPRGGSSTDPVRPAKSRARVSCRVIPGICRPRSPRQCNSGAETGTFRGQRAPGERVRGRPAPPEAAGPGPPGPFMAIGRGRWKRCARGSPRGC